MNDYDFRWLNSYGKSHRIDGPAYKSYNKKSTRPFAFFWSYNDNFVIPYSKDVNPGSIIIIDKKIYIIIRHIEGLVWEALCGDKKFFVMEKQKKYIKLVNRTNENKRV